MKKDLLTGFEFYKQFTIVIRSFSNEKIEIEDDCNNGYIDQIENLLKKENENNSRRRKK